MSDQTTIYSDAQTYDLIHSVSNGKDFDFYRRLALSGQQVLEVACGSGRLTIPLAQTGFKMTGLDVSRDMIEQGKAKAQSTQVEINWVEGNCKDFSLGQKFSLIFMACNSIQHLHQNSQVLSFLERVKEHLEPGGIFACDLFKPDPKILSRAAGEKHPVCKYKNHDGMEISLDETNVYDKHLQINSIQWYHSEPSGNVIKTQVLEMRQFFPEEIDRLLTQSGLEIVEKYDNWDRTGASDEGFKQIFVCKKSL